MHVFARESLLNHCRVMTSVTHGALGCQPFGFKEGHEPLLALPKSTKCTKEEEQQKRTKITTTSQSSKRAKATREQQLQKSNSQKQAKAPKEQKQQEGRSYKKGKAKQK